MKAFRLLTICFTVACASPLAAQEADGLNADLRESLYNSATAVVATLQTGQLSQQALMQTVYGLFEPAALALVKQGQKDFDQQLKGMTGFTAVASGLAGLGYERLTVVGLNWQNQKVFGALNLGFEVSDAVFLATKPAIETLFSSNGFSAELTQRGNYVLIHSPNAGLDPLEHSQEIENAILAGLSQPRGTPAVAVVAPTSDYVRAMLGASPGASSPFTKALADSDYIGGYIVTGGRPKIHLYARFSGEPKANAVKAIYDQSWNDQMAVAKAADAQHEADIAAGNIHTNWYINNETMYGRIRAAATLKVFGGVVLLDLDTPALHEITGALVDGYLHPSP